ncbi:CRISPR-associated protein Csx19 [Lysinibacillus sp. FSL H8-0500]|uniref:type III-D CRISPR-associated protein Csx19 n=1 Tax=Lysinibacillus sp. FSL H8-0500 TaxID=2921393 RepID=UPI0031015708
MKHRTIKSQMDTGRIPQEELLSFICAQKNGDIYIMADDAVYFGQLDNGKIKLYNDAQFEESYVQEVRVFDESKELKLIRRNSEFLWRTRKDSQGNGMIYFDDTHKLWGRVAKSDGKWSVLQEGRGMKIAIPREFKEKEHVVLVFRKYLAFQDWDLTIEQPFCYSIVDERLVKYEKMEEVSVNEQ